LGRCFGHSVMNAMMRFTTMIAVRDVNRVHLANVAGVVGAGSCVRLCCQCFGPRSAGGSSYVTLVTVTALCRFRRMHDDDLIVHSRSFGF